MPTLRDDHKFSADELLRMKKMTHPEKSVFIGPEYRILAERIAVKLTKALEKPISVIKAMKIMIDRYSSPK